MWDAPVFGPYGGPEMKRKRYSDEKNISILKSTTQGRRARIFHDDMASPPEFDTFGKNGYAHLEDCWHEMAGVV